MSEATVSSTHEVTISIPLLHEGTDVLRRTRGIVLEPGAFRVVATPDYDPAVEEWQFLPGSAVRCVKEFRGGREVLVARDQVGCPPAPPEMVTGLSSSSWRRMNDNRDIADPRSPCGLNTGGR